MRAVCFLTDYGYADDFAGVCRGVIARLAPGVQVIDITHGIVRHDVLGAALVLRNTMRYMPDSAVHLVVVDPGVGGPRRPVALLSAHDRLFVGPDNGVLMPACEADGGVAEARELSNRELFLQPQSATFHGRDIFAPVAGRLAWGIPFESLGTVVDPATLVRPDIPVVRTTKRGLRAAAVLIDRFGNVALNIDAERLEKARFGDLVELVCRGERYIAHTAHTFSSVQPSDIMILVDSYGQVAVAVNSGSAKDVLGIKPGDPIELRRLPEG